MVKSERSLQGVPSGFAEPRQRPAVHSDVKLHAVAAAHGVPSPRIVAEHTPALHFAASARHDVSNSVTVHGAPSAFADTTHKPDRQ
jgi:hypothetical protein